MRAMGPHMTHWYTVVVDDGIPLDHGILSLFVIHTRAALIAAA